MGHPQADEAKMKLDLMCMSKDTDSTINILKMFSSNVSEEDVNRRIEEAKSLGFVVGARVHVNGVEDGVIVNHNHSTGMFDGARCPVIVKRDDGHTFEYATEQLVLI